MRVVQGWGSWIHGSWTIDKHIFLLTYFLGRPWSFLWSEVQVERKLSPSVVGVIRGHRGTHLLFLPYEGGEIHYITVCRTPYHVPVILTMIFDYEYHLL